MSKLDELDKVQKGLTEARKWILHQPGEDRLEPADEVLYALDFLRTITLYLIEPIA